MRVEGGEWRVRVRVEVGGWVRAAVGVRWGVDVMGGG